MRSPQPPLIAALLLALTRRDEKTLALFCLVGAYALLSISGLVSGDLRQSLLQNGHLRPRSLASWLVLQPLPKMYGYEHRALVGGRTPPRSDVFEREARWVNHYPGRVARFDGERVRVMSGARRPQAVFLRSRYRGTSVTTGLYLVPQGGKLVLLPRELGAQELAR